MLNHVQEATQIYFKLLIWAAFLFTLMPAVTHLHGYAGVTRLAERYQITILIGTAMI